MHNFPLDKVFGSWFVCTPENCSFVHIRRVMSTCQHVKRCFACRDGSYVLGADVLLISWRVGRRVKSSKIKYGTLCHKSWCAREHERYHPPHLNPHLNPNLTPRMIRVQCWCVQGNMNTHPAPPPQPQPQPVIGLACADVCLRRASMSHSWRAQMRALGVCRWVVCPRSQS